MNIELSQEEYELLVEMIYTADYVYNAYLNEQDQEREKYHTLQQKIMSFAKQFKKENLVEWDDECNQLIPSKDYYENSTSVHFIEDFEINTFWEQLIDRLAIRDLFNQHGEDTEDWMSSKKYISPEAITKQQVELLKIA
jgi:hypothetical protein